jgi:hypothetical protein
VSTAGVVSFPCFVYVRGVRIPEITNRFFENFFVEGAVLFDSDDGPHYTAITLEETLSGTDFVFHDVLADGSFRTNAVSMQEFVSRSATRVFEILFVRGPRPLAAPPARRTETKETRAKAAQTPRATKKSTAKAAIENNTAMKVATSSALKNAFAKNTAPRHEAQRRPAESTQRQAGCEQRVIPYDDTFPKHLRQDTMFGSETRPATYWEVPAHLGRTLGRIVRGALSGYTPGPDGEGKAERIRKFLEIPSKTLSTSDARDWRKEMKNKLLRARAGATAHQNEETTERQVGTRQRRTEAARVAQEVITKTRAGFPGRGMDVLLRAAKPQRHVTDERKIQELRRLHPAPSSGDSVTHLTVANPVLEFSADEFVHQAAARRWGSEVEMAAIWRAPHARS